MPHVISLILSAAITVAYALIWTRLEHHYSSPERMILNVCTGTLIAFWGMRALGYWWIVDGHNIVGANLIFRYSAYFLVLPAVVMAVVMYNRRDK